MKSKKYICRSNSLTWSLILLLVLITGCGKKEQALPVLKFSTEQEKEAFALKSESERYKLLGMSRIEVMKRSFAGQDTTLKLSEIRYLNLDGSLKYLVEVVGSDTIITLYRWNSSGKPAAIHRYDGQERLRDSVFYFYDSRGNVMEVDSNGIVENFTNIYDKKGRLFQVIPAITVNGSILVKEQFTYNDDGSFTHQTRPKSESGEYLPPLYLTYDKLRNLITVTWEGVPIRQDFEYDKYGRSIRGTELSQMIETTFWEYSYDEYFNMISEVKRDGSKNVVEEKVFKYYY